MKYFVFDMDEAIAELYSAFYFIMSLRLTDTMEKQYPGWFEKSDPIVKQVKTAYQHFVKLVLQEELSYRPLGILRPGVLQVMKLLRQLQMDKKVAHVVIYSNNDSLECLEFIRDVIHEYLETKDLICECAHRSHPLRDEFSIKYRFRPIDKSWESLKRVLVEGKCKAPDTLSPEDVYFFDDLIHPDLQAALGKQYHRVPAYEFKASYHRLVDLYIDSLIEGRVSMLKFAPMVAMAYGTSRMPEITSLQHILSLFRASTVKTASIDDIPPLKDRGISIMKDTIYSLKNRRIKKKTRKRHTHKRDL
jgi:hypothetical protein